VICGLRLDAVGAFGESLPTVNDSFWPILLKKSTWNSTAEKYAPEIEI
jgi:hypothetical protein